MYKHQLVTIISGEGGRVSFIQFLKGFLAIFYMTPGGHRRTNEEWVGDTIKLAKKNYNY